MKSRRANPRSTVATGFLTGMLAGLSPSSPLRAELLNDAGIAIGLIDDPRARIPVARYASLYRLLTERIGDEGFALFSRPIRRGSFEFLCRAVLSATDLNEALERAGRYLALVIDDLAIEVRQSGASAQLHIHQTGTFQATGAGRVFAFEWLLRLINGLGAWLIARPLAFDAVEFPYPEPAHAFDYGLVFAPQCSFDAPGLVAHFPLDYLSAPVRRDETALRLFLSEAPASITTLYRRDRAVSLRTRDAIRAALPEQRTLPEVARLLFLSPRTLHRRLGEEGTTFRAIRDGLRRDLAVDWLTKSQRPLGRIAADLGFADASAFYRAFAGWTGEGPRQFRLRTHR